MSENELYIPRHILLKEISLSVKSKVSHTEPYRPCHTIVIKYTYGTKVLFSMNQTSLYQSEQSGTIPYYPVPSKTRMQTISYQHALHDFVQYCKLRRKGQDLSQHGKCTISYRLYHTKPITYQ